MKKKRILALMLVLIMSILSAWGTKKTTDVKKEATTSNTGMGRYVEESVELPEMSWPSPLFEMQDVTLEVLDQDSLYNIFRLIKVTYNPLLTVYLYKNILYNYSIR